jgi:hypothetical protein
METVNIKLRNKIRVKLLPLPAKRIRIEAEDFNTDFFNHLYVIHVDCPAGH